MGDSLTTCVERPGRLGTVSSALQHWQACAPCEEVGLELMARSHGLHCSHGDDIPVLYVDGGSPPTIHNCWCTTEQFKNALVYHQEGDTMASPSHAYERRSLPVGYARSNKQRPVRRPWAKS